MWKLCLLLYRQQVSIRICHRTVCQGTPVYTKRNPPDKVPMGQAGMIFRCKVVRSISSAAPSSLESTDGIMRLCCGARIGLSETMSEGETLVVDCCRTSPAVILRRSQPILPSLLLLIPTIFTCDKWEKIKRKQQRQLKKIQN